MPKAAAVKEKIKQFTDAAARELVSNPLSQIIRDHMFRYGRKTVEDRAIPDYRDGMIPVQRRVLWSMYEMRLRSSGSYVKCARVVGDTLGKFHPHGDTACYGSLANMVQSVFPLIDGQGNFGNFDGSNPAAMRYTECRLLASTELLMLDPDYIAVTDMVPTYDSSGLEPIVLPAKLPMSLVTGCKMGIAVGTTTKIPAFSIESVSAIVAKAAAAAVATKAVPSVTTKQCIKTLEMSTEWGGVITSTEEEISEVISTGVGRITWMCDYTWDAGLKAFIITGVGPGWSYAAGMRKLRALEGVSAVDDVSSDELGIRIIVHPQRGYERQHIEPALKKALTTAQSNFTNVTKRFKKTVEGYDVAEASFDKYGAPDIINEWFKYRYEIEQRMQRKVIEDLKVKINRLELLLKAIDKIELIFALLNPPKNVAILTKYKIKLPAKGAKLDKVAELAKVLAITPEDSLYIWRLEVRRLDNLDATDLKAEVTALKAEIKVAQGFMSNPATKIVADMKLVTKGL